MCVVECVEEEEYCIVIRFVSFVSDLMRVLVSCGRSEEKKSSKSRARKIVIGKMRCLKIKHPEDHKNVPYTCLQ